VAGPVGAYQEGDLAPEGSSVLPIDPARNVAFADPAPAPSDPTPATRMATQLAQEAGPAWSRLLDDVRALVESADSLESLDAALLASFADLPTTELRDVMQTAYAVADLAGRFDVRSE
jgi:phage gp29-like protein